MAEALRAPKHLNHEKELVATRKRYATIAMKKRIVNGEAPLG